jgi:hypothetical protein
LLGVLNVFVNTFHFNLVVSFVCNFCILSNKLDLFKAICFIILMTYSPGRLSYPKELTSSRSSTLSFLRHRVLPTMLKFFLLFVTDALPKSGGVFASDMTVFSGQFK